MKIKFLFTAVMLLIFSSCKNEPKLPHIYEKNPQYKYMLVDYYGKYYEEMGVSSNLVFSLSFYSEGMLNGDSSEVVASGQFLYIEELFVSEEKLSVLGNLTEDIVLDEQLFLNLLEGEYRAVAKDSVLFGDSLTFLAGEYYKVDSGTYLLGARITYTEEDAYNSKRKLVTDGVFSIDETGVQFDLLTDDGEKLFGEYGVSSLIEQRSIVVKYTSEKDRERIN